MNLTDRWEGSLDGGSARRKAATYTVEGGGAQTYMHASVGFEPTIHSVLAGECMSCLRPHGHCDRLIYNYFVKYR
jgi:hypothetical protein